MSAGERRATAAIRRALRDNEPTEEQWRAITAGLTPQSVVAGAGSGKTAVMAARMVWLIETGRARADGILGLTFTNKASAELEERVTQATALIDPHPGETPTVMTYHSFADRIVREHGARLGIDAEASLLTEAQKWQLLLGLVDALPSLEALELRHPLSFIKQTLTLGEQCAQHALTPERVKEESERLAGAEREEKAKAVHSKRRDFAVILRYYIDAKRRAGRIDYGDQITIALELLQRFPDVAAGLRERYPVVLLDEYQDTDPAQKRLLQQLCPPGSAVTAVGDVRQAIYGWRGASMYNLVMFPLDFPVSEDGGLCETYTLAANYRSGRRIVETANRLIESVPEERRGGGPPLVAHPAHGEGWVGAGLFGDEGAEASYVADVIERSHGEGREWREHAVLLRRHRYMDVIAAELERRDIPFEIPELGGLLKTPPIVDIVAWLRVLSDTAPATNRWLARILLGPRFRIHYRDLAPIARWAAQRTAELRVQTAEELGVQEPDPGEVAFSMLDAITHADEIEGVSDDARRRLHEFTSLRTELLRHARRPLSELVAAVVERSGVAETLEASPSRSAPALLRHIQTFLGVCAEFSPVRGEPTLASFLEYLDAVEDSEDAIPIAIPVPQDSVKIMTIHQAKGLEWDVVFLPVLASEQSAGRDGWPRGSVFPDVRATDPFASAQTLPNTIRDDGQHLPKPEDHGTRVAYRAELKKRAEEDERRLLYVAVTRARRELHCTAAWWYGTEERKGPSKYWNEIAELDHLVETLRRDEAPDSSPVVMRMSQRLGWPPAAAASDATLEWIAVVDDLAAGLRTADDVLAGAGDEARRLYADHVREIEALTADGGGRAARSGRRSLPATVAARLALGIERVEDALRPEIVRPDEARRLGVEVHAWIEEVSRGLTGLAEEEALEEPSVRPDDETVSAMREVYERMGWPDRIIGHLDSGEPMAELPFTLKVGGRLVRGRIDAVYELGDSFEIVDFKTGASEAEWGQLELYAEALSELGILRGPVKLTFAYLRDARAESRDYSPRGLGWLEEGLAKL